MKPITPGTDTRYIYQVARVKVLETRLMDKNAIERLIEAKDIGIFIKALSENPSWQASILSVDSKNFNEVSEREFSGAKKLFYELCPDLNLLSAFLIRYDVNNLKILAKAKRFGSSSPQRLSSLGFIEPGRITDSFNNNRLGEFGFGLEIPAAQTQDMQQPKDIDNLFDKFMYNLMYRRINKSANSFLGQYLVKLIDLNNIISFLRLRRSDAGKDAFKEVFLQNGAVHLSFFMEFFGKELDIFIGNFKTSEYAAFLHEGSVYYQNKNSFAGYERARRNFLMRYIKAAKYFCFGVEPIVAYFLAKENEIDTVGLIYTAKSNHLGDNFIRERLVETYV